MALLSRSGDWRDVIRFDLITRLHETDKLINVLDLNHLIHVTFFTEQPLPYFNDRLFVTKGKTQLGVKTKSLPLITPLALDKRMDRVVYHVGTALCFMGEHHGSVEHGLKTSRQIV